MPDNQQPSSEKHRLCKTCRAVRPLVDFPIYDRFKGSRRNECIDCRRVYQAKWARGEIKVSKNEATRTCKKCNAVRPVDEFAKVYSKNTRGTMYRQHTCIDCARRESADKERIRRKENPEHYRDKYKKSWARNRDKKLASRRLSDKRLRDDVFSKYGGYVCVCCGETMPSMLTLDHVNNDGAKHRKENKAAAAGRGLLLWCIANNFPKTMQVLCYNCNISKYRNGGICEHKLREGSTTIPEGSTAKRLEMQSTQ